MSTNEQKPIAGAMSHHGGKDGKPGDEGGARVTAASILAKYGQLPAGMTSVKDMTRDQRRASRVFFEELYLGVKVKGKRVGGGKISKEEYDILMAELK